MKKKDRQKGQIQKPGGLQSQPSNTPVRCGERFADFENVLYKRKTYKTKRKDAKYTLLRLFGTDY